MCGRLGSTLTVCDSPMWLVSPISTGVRDVGHVDDLQAALRCVCEPEHALVVAAARGVGGVDEELGVVADRVAGSRR